MFGFPTLVPIIFS